MSMEIAFNDDLVRADLVLGYSTYSLHPENEGIALVNEPQRFTLLSVLAGLEKAVVADRAEAEADGEVFDRANWMPSDEVVTNIFNEHRIHRHYLRGIAGLKEQLKEMVDGQWDSSEPFYDHQLEGMRLMIADMESHDPFAESSKGSYFNISGGGGKSRMIAMAAAGFKKFDTPDDPSRIMFVSQDNVGLAEVVGADRGSGLGKYAPHLKVGIVNKNSKQYDEEVLATNRTSLRLMAERDPQSFDPFSLILSDESHGLLGEKTQAAVRGIPRRVYGFTGSDRFNEERKLSDLLSGSLMDVSTYELIMANSLAPMQFWVCKTNVVIHRESGSEDYTQAELDMIAKMEARHQIAAEFGLAFFKDGRNGVFSCNNIQEANLFAEMMSGEVAMPDGSIRKIVVKPVHSKTKNNHETFKALGNDEIQGVTIVDIDTAWDAPLLSFLVNMRPASLVKSKQRSARVYRRFYDADGNVITGQIVDLCDIVKVDSKSGEDEFAPQLPQQLFAAMLLGQTHYQAGQIIASPLTEGKRRDFAYQNFPPHIRRALTIADGVPFTQLAVFGSGAIREEGIPGEDEVTFRQAAFALGVTTTRLAVAVTALSMHAREIEFLNKKQLDRLAQHFIDRDEPIV
ncbi:MAG TPA: hypothetical protein VLI54_01070 [Bacillota bacterium]|nr:hypothetical protein [Bacillota bacterium]